VIITLTVGQTWKPSRLRPARCAPSSSGSRSVGREKYRQPAVRDLAGERHVPGTERGQVDRDSLLDRPDAELQRLARAVGQRQVDRLAVELHLLVLQGQAHDRHVLARALQLLAESDAVEALRDLRPRRAEAQDEAPVGKVVDGGRGHRGHGGAARGDLKDACPELDARRAGGQPGERRGGVGAVGLGGPQRVVAEPLRGLGDLQARLGRHAEAPVADHHPELHSGRILTSK